MIKTSVIIEGMMCKMCEAHVENAVKENFAVKKIKASHVRGDAEIISENPLEKQEVIAVIEKAGYKAVSVSEKEYNKRGIFSFFSRKN